MSIKSSKKLFIWLVLTLLLLMAFAGPALSQSQTPWYASYWNNPSHSGAPSYQRTEAGAPDIGWGEGSPAPGIASDYFSARWTATEQFNPGQYRFFLRTDDGARLWVNNQKILDIDETGTVFTADVDITEAGPVPMRLDFWEEKGNAGVHLTWERIGDIATTGPILAEYFNNMTLSGSPVLVRNEGPGLYHNWGGGSPDPSINDDHFSARYSMAMKLSPGWYRFTTMPDDGFRFWVNNDLVIDRWYDADGTPTSGDVYIPGGVVNFLAHYYENVGNAQVNISMTRLDTSSGGAGGGFGGGTDTSSSGGAGGGFGGGDNAVVPVPIPPPANSSAIVNTIHLNMRSGPGTEYNVIRTLNMGDVVVLTGLNSGSWVHVQTQDNFAGWVNASYLAYNDSTGEAFSNK